MKTIVHALSICSFACMMAIAAGSSDSGDTNAVSSRDTRIVPLVWGGMPGAEAFLKAEQNVDGSWGKEAHACKATALAMAGFLRRGGNTQTIEKACDWLLVNEPKSDTDTVAVIVALSNYYRVQGTDRGEPKAMASDARPNLAAAKVSALLLAIGKKPSDVWQDLLAITGLPDESKRPQWAPRDAGKKNAEKYAKKTDEFRMESLDDYLNLLLTSGAKRERVKDYFKTYANTLLDRQGPDGSFGTNTDDDKFAATAIVFMMQSRYVHGAPFLGPLPEKKSRKD